VSTNEDDIQPVRVRVRPRPPRQVIIDPETPREPPPPEPFMTTGLNDRFEFAGNPLPSDPNAQITEIAKYSRGAAVEDRHRLLRPLMARNATPTEIARLFGCSIMTADRWKREYRQWVRKNAIAVDPLQEYAEHMDRLSLMANAAWNELMRPQGEGETLSQTSRRTRVLRILNELERTRVAINQAYGVAYDGVLEKEKLKNGEESGGETLIEMVKGFADMFVMSDNASLDDIADVVGGSNV
jgi:hypothetical protein